MKQFYAVPTNNLVSNATHGHLWFALVFWVLVFKRDIDEDGMAIDAAVVREKLKACVQQLVARQSAKGEG